jgi:Na+/H+-dicarboxylate symporter
MTHTVYVKSSLLLGRSGIRLWNLFDLKNSLAFIVQMKAVISCLNENAGIKVPEKIFGFTLPLGNIANMDGCRLTVQALIA